MINTQHVKTICNEFMQENLFELIDHQLLTNFNKYLIKETGCLSQIKYTIDNTFEIKLFEQSDLIVYTYDFTIKNTISK